MVLKPLVGVLSDRWGRRAWLLLGTALFTGMPFAYRLVHTPEQLFVLRLVHGMATAVYGPVTLAYVGEMSGGRRAERLGWFSIARNGSYVVGPAVAGLMLLALDPVSVFTVIGLLSSAAFVPVLLLKERGPRRAAKPPLLRHAVSAIATGAKTPAVWLVGGMESSRTIGVYAAKAFLPLHAYALGASPALIGAFFAVQETVNMVLSPLGGRISDRVGHLGAVGLGMLVLGLAMVALTLVDTGPALMAPAVLAGLGQALGLPGVPGARLGSPAGGQHGTGHGTGGGDAERRKGSRTRAGGDTHPPDRLRVDLPPDRHRTAVRRGDRMAARAGLARSGCSGFQLASSSYLNMSLTGICHPGTMSSTPSTSGSVSTTASVSERCTFTVHLRGSTTMTASVPAVSQSATFSSTSV